MSEAQRLKMTGGHFIWIWADTSSTAEFFQPNSVQNTDDKDQKSNYNSHFDEFVQIKSYDKLGAPTERQYYQQPSGNKRLQQNNTRNKSLNSNTNRFHHIIGLRKAVSDEDAEGISAVVPDRSFLKNDKFINNGMAAGQVTIKDKRTSKRFNDASSTTIDQQSSKESDNGADYVNSYEKMSTNLHIKNINSREFNANYYDPYSQAQSGVGGDNIENVFKGDSDASSDEETGYDDYDKINPFNSNPQHPPPTSTSTRRSSLDSKNANSKANNHKNSNRNNGNNNKAVVGEAGGGGGLDQITTIPYSKLFDDNDDLSLDSYGDSTPNDLKAKRADNFPSSFNISSHVFFHHFKDFPVGLLALRHIKMNVDRTFVRSAIRLFATTWSRVEKDEEMRMSSSGGGGGSVAGSDRKNNNWQHENMNDSDYDYDEVNNYNNNKSNNKKLRNKTNVNVNSRHNNARGSRKYKRDAPEALSSSSASNSESISTLVNSSNKTSNSNSKLINKLSYSQHVSDLTSNSNDNDDDEDVIKSNNDTTKHDNDANNNSKESESASEQRNRNPEVIRVLNMNGDKSELNKRQSSWWSNTLRGRNQDKTKGPRGTPNYKGGCFGTPTRVDLKRSELFSR